MGDQSINPLDSILVQSFQRSLTGVARPHLMAGNTVIVKPGDGHSDVARHPAAYTAEHHPQIFCRVMCEVVADFPSTTPRQLLDLGRRALTV